MRLRTKHEVQDQAVVVVASASEKAKKSPLSGAALHQTLPRRVAC